jgi:hypothetical protein
MPCGHFSIAMMRRFVVVERAGHHLTARLLA